MNSIQTYDPDQDDYEKKYHELLKRVGALEKKLVNMNKADEEDGSVMEWDPDAVEGMTDKWIFDQLTTINECLKLIAENGKSQIAVNERTEEAIKGINMTLGSMTEKPKTSHSGKDPFGGMSLSDRTGMVDGKCIRTVDDFDWEMDEKGGLVFSDLAGPDNGLHAEGSNDPAKTKVDTSKLTRVMGPTIVNPIGREYSYCLDGDRLEYIIHLMVRQDYHPTAIRYGERGVDIVFSKNDNTMVTKTLHLDKI